MGFGKRDIRKGGGRSSPFPADFRELGDDARKFDGDAVAPHNFCDCVRFVLHTRWRDFRRSRPPREQRERFNRQHLGTTNLATLIMAD